MPDIVLKNKKGEDVTHEDIETVTFDTPIENEQAIFTYGQAVSGVELIPNFAEGDQVIAETQGVLVRSGVIKKPETLVAENIKSGVEIAGVTGEFEGNALENVPIALDLSEGNQTITAPEGYLVKSAIIQKPETLIPSNIAEGVDIGGVVGTFQGGSGLDEAVRYFDVSIDPKKSEIIITKVHYDKIYEDTGSYDVTIPDVLCGCNVLIKHN